MHYTVFERIVNKMYCGLRHSSDLYLEYKNNIVKSNDNRNGANIVIAPIDGRAIHTWEGIFARKAMMNGYTVHGIFCNQNLSHCEYISKYTSYPKARCMLCKTWTKEFIDAFGVKPIFYQDELDNHDIKEIENYTDEFFKTVHEKHVFLKVDVDELLRSGLQRFYLEADPLIQDGDVERQTLTTILKTLVLMDKICKRLHPSLVLSSHGVYSTWGPVIEYCKAHQIYCVTYGRSYNKNGVTFGYNNSYLKRDLEDNKNLWRTRELDAMQKARVESFFEQRIGLSEKDVAYDYNKKNKKIYAEQEIRDFLNIDPSTKIVGLFPNIPWDGQVSGTGDVFPRYQDWLKTTVDFFKDKPDVVLVIRTHPAESLKGFAVGDETMASMMGQLYPELPKNIIILPKDHWINSYALALSSSFGVVYCSTISLELTYLGIPIIVGGYPEFGKKGIMNDISSREHYLTLLQEGMDGKLCVSSQQKEDLIKFSHYFFFETIMPETLLELSDEDTVGFKFSNEEKLNSDAVFDEMFTKIVNNQAVDFSSFY